MHERSGKAIGGYNWLRSGRPRRQLVAIFDQVAVQFDSGNRLTGP